jgi:hypothetical protein
MHHSEGVKRLEFKWNSEAVFYASMVHKMHPTGVMADSVFSGFVTTCIVAFY